MKFAVITDIHGNAPALSAVLAEIDADKEIKEIYCLGDMIGIGPDTNEVLELLFSRADVSMITGNHDEAVLALCKGLSYPASHQPVKAHHEWIAAKIDHRYVSLLGRLPRTLVRNIEGRSVLFTHYHLRADKRRAAISDEPFHAVVAPELAAVEELFRDTSQELICFGHHHPVHCFQGRRATYLNPGSLGCNDQSVAPYAVVEIGKRTLNIELREAEYDRTAFLASYEVLRVPDRELILKVFHGQGTKAGAAELAGDSIPE